MVDLPRSFPTPAENNNKQFNTIGSDKLDQCSCKLTNTSLLLVDGSSLLSGLVLVPRIETVLAILKLVCTKYMFGHSNVDSSYLCLLIYLPSRIYTPSVLIHSYIPPIFACIFVLLPVC